MGSLILIWKIPFRDAKLDKEEDLKRSPSFSSASSTTSSSKSMVQGSVRSLTAALSQRWSFLVLLMVSVIGGLRLSFLFQVYTNVVRNISCSSTSLSLKDRQEIERIRILLFFRPSNLFQSLQFTPSLIAPPCWSCYLVTAS